jgi:hypothetical protein
MLEADRLIFSRVAGWVETSTDKYLASPAQSDTLDISLDLSVATFS